MEDHSKTAVRVTAMTCVAISLLSITSIEAAADRVGGSNIPQSTPPLKGRLADDRATSAIVIGAGAGATTNAGPTLLERPSAFVDQSLAYAQFMKIGLARLDVSANLTNRRYTNFADADEIVGSASAALSRDWGGAQTSVALNVSSGSDVEERLTESSLTIEHAVTQGAARPYVRGEIALLDFRDMPGDPGPFQNQDDRDRISSRLLAGVRVPLSNSLTLETGAGLDVKSYIAPTDDFGVDRDSLSAFPLIGLAYAGDQTSFRAVYTPLRRMYREALFEGAWEHGYQIEAEAKLTDQWKTFGAARYGFEETDFLIASSAYERVVLAGLTLTLPAGVVSAAVSRSWRTYDGLDLIEIERSDDKTEFAIAGEFPLTESLSLNAKAAYLGYASSFGLVETEALTTSLGLSYAVTN